MVMEAPWFFTRTHTIWVMCLSCLHTLPFSSGGSRTAVSESPRSPPPTGPRMVAPDRPHHTHRHSPTHPSTHTFFRPYLCKTKKVCVWPNESICRNDFVRWTQVTLKDWHRSKCFLTASTEVPNSRGSLNIRNLWNIWKLLLFLLYLSYDSLRPLVGVKCIAFCMKKRIHVRLSSMFT